MNRKIIVCAILVIGSFAAAASKAQAQLDPQGPPKFKVGDRVEYDSLQAMDPANAKWVKATVTKIVIANLGGSSTQTSYVIRLDSGGEISVTRHHAEEGHGWAGPKPTAFLRPLAGADTQPPNADQPNNNPAPNQPNPPANNGAAGGKYKKGDCVDFDVLETGDATRAEWKPGEIVDVQNVKLSSTQTQLTYVVQLDQPGPSGLPQRFPISQRLAEQGMTYAGDPNRLTGFFRPRPCDGNAPNIESGKLRMDANGTVLADRELLNCDNVKSGPAVNGQRPNSEMVKQLIRCLWEQPSKPGQDGAEKVDILDLTPGPSHRWDRLIDMGSGASIDTIVYTFRVKYNVETFYHTYNQLDQNQQAIFSCFVGVGKWQCGYYQRISDGEKKMIPVEK